MRRLKQVISLRSLLWLLTIVLLIACIVWLVDSPGYEPFTVLVAALISLFASFRVSDRPLLRRKVQELESAYPFELIQNPDQLLRALLPDFEEATIQDRSITYLPGRLPELDNTFMRHGRVLLRGRSKAGKTREMAELIRRRWHTGMKVLLLSDMAWLAPPYLPLDKVPYRNIVLVINDVDHYCRLDQFELLN